MTIVAWEWRTTPDVVMTWDFQTFLDALQWVAERRYGSAMRRASRKEDAQVQRAHAQMR